MNREGKKCVLYPRVSTEMQVDGYSLEGQKNGLKRFADREEMEIVGIYEDAGKSGKSIEGRPAFKKMLSDIKNGLEIDYILVYKLSRFGRNAADILNSLEFEKENKKLREELEYYRNRNYGGRKKHDETWMASYNDFVSKYKNGMTLMEIVAEGKISRRTAYRYKAYYEELKKMQEGK